MENFDLDILTELFNNTPQQDKDYKTCKDYILKSVFPIHLTDMFVIFENNKLITIEDNIFKKQYLLRFPKPLINWFKTSSDVKSFYIVSDPKQPTIDFKTRKINNHKSIIAQYKKYADFPAETKSQCETILNHLKNVNCSGDVAQYEFLLKIIKNMCNGVKNNIIVMLVGKAQGTGKSSIIKFLQDQVIGNDLTCVGDHTQISTGFNISMFGKTFIYYDEAETIFTKNNASLAVAQ